MDISLQKAQAVIPAMSLGRFGSPYPERNCENSVNITKALSKKIVGRQYKKAETQSTMELKIQTNREQSHIIKLDQISERMTDNKKNPTNLIKDLDHITA